MSRGGTVRTERKQGMSWRYATGVLLMSMLALALLAGSPGQGRSADKFKLKKGANGEVCLKCHEDFKEKLKKRFLHTPVAKRDCSGCHSPHTSNHGKLLGADPGRVCETCHDAMVPKGA